MLGLALHHIVNPIIMGGLYFCAVVPMGIIFAGQGQRSIAPAARQVGGQLLDRSRTSGAPTGQHDKTVLGKARVLSR